MRRFGLMVCALLVACADDERGLASNDVTTDSGAAGSASGGSAGSGGAGTSGSAGVVQATGGSAGAPDAGACKTECLGNECGFALPNGCGSTLDCGDCGPGTDYCIKLDSVHAAAVHNAHMAIQTDHPEWFDLNDMSGSNAKLLDLDAYRNELLQRLIAGGRVAISDPNDAAEIRVRAPEAISAENFRLVTSSGYSWDHYTSTCTPAGF